MSVLKSCAVYIFAILNLYVMFLFLRVDSACICNINYNLDYSCNFITQFYEI